jgi:sigma-B regulation protein RsbU (phosphoserine phosphatase)
MIGTEVPSETVTIESLRESELQEARAIQLAMLASEGLRTPWVTIESEFQPVSEVGGDFLDYFLLSDGTAGLYLGDVTGKGLPAALFAASRETGKQK